jgi:DNA invertase Pin-like site-specific DNA recombinase
MKLLKTIERLIQEAEEQYNLACDSCATVEELDRLENRYKDSLRLMKLYKSKEKSEESAQN